MPLYNMEDYIEETLLSITASEYGNIEVVVMDDGSTDHSLQVAQRFAEADSRVHVYTQPNAGVCAARNKAIALSTGEYILPVDADNLITADYIQRAAEVLDRQPAVKGVGCEAMFFGDKHGRWRVRRYSPRLLARKNMIDTCAMYRKTDYMQTQGYCESVTAREDWDFWLSMLETGGTFHRLPQICLYYRVRKNSKRINDRQQKRALIDSINARHKDFIYRQLGGPLHYHRSISRLINIFNRII